MAVTFKLEHDGSQLTITITEFVTLEALEECLRITSEHIPLGINKLLVRRADAALDTEMRVAIDFGHKAGEIVANAGVAMAIVQAPEHDHEAFVDVGLYSEGVLIAPFHDEDDAREWLLSKRP